MSHAYGPYHRLGKPGGLGCHLAVLPVTTKGSDGLPVSGSLLDGGPDCTEVELLRTIASRFGVRWGHDDLGWWAAIRGEFPSWAVWRSDESGDKILMDSNLSEEHAKAMVADFEARGHKETYWCNNQQIS